MDPKRLQRIKHPLVRQAITDFLVNFVDPSDPATQQSFREWGNPADADLASNRSLMHELKWLRMFAVDFNVSQFLGETPAKRAILDSFYSALSSQGAVDKAYLERAATYAEAVNSGAPDYAFAVGRAFSRFLGAPESLDGGLRARNQFMALSMALSEFFVKATNPPST